MITMDLFHEIRVLSRKTKSKSKIARELNIDRKTVRKYLESASPPRYAMRSEPSREDPFKEFESFVREKLEVAPGLSAGEVYALIRTRGYQGSERTIQRRLKAFKAEKPKERFFEQEYEPGEQAQFDFKESVELAFAHGPEIVHLHFGTLPFSGTCKIKGYPQKTYECFMDGVHSFFEQIGGMPKNIRIDNLSPCVKRVRRDGGRDYTAAFERAIEYYDFGVLPCSPGKGNEKGDVERDIRTWARRFLNHVKVHGLIFKDFAHVNAVLTQFVDQEIGPKDLAAKEADHLLDLLPRDESILCRVEETRASSFGTVRILKTTYSVPDEWIDQMCRVVAGPFEVKITRVGSKTPVVVHPRKPEGGHSVLLEHVVKSLLRKPRAMIRWRHREILFPDPVFEALYRRLKSQETLPGAPERELLRILNLIHHAPFNDIRCAVEIVLETDCWDLFCEVKELVISERRPPEPCVVIDLARFNQIPIEPNLKTYDEHIPKELSLG